MLHSGILLNNYFKMNVWLYRIQTYNSIITVLTKDCIERIVVL